MTSINKRQLRFISLNLENFYPYKGEENFIEFSKDLEKPLNMIVGPNGAGKSKLFEAFFWAALEGEEREKEKKIAMTNTEIFKERTSFNVSVTIKYEILEETGGSTEYEISKKFLVTNPDLNIDTATFGSESIELKKDGGRVLSNVDPEIYTDILNDLRERYFPSAVRGFLFIKGEYIEDQFSEENSDELRDFAISSSDLPYIDLLVSFLDRVIDYWDRNRSEILRNEERFKSADEKYIETKNRLEQLQKGIKETQLQITAVEDSLEKKKKDQQLLIAETEKQLLSEKLDVEKKSMEKEKKRIQNEMSKLLQENLAFIYLKEDLIEIQKYLNSIPNLPRLLPRDIAEDIYNTLKDTTSSKCPCCNSDWEELSSQFLKEYIDNLPENESSEVIFIYQNELEKKLAIFYEKINEIQQKRDELRDLNLEIRKKEVEKQRLGETLSGDQRKKFSELDSEIKGLEKDKAKLDRHLVRLKGDLGEKGARAEEYTGAWKLFNDAKRERERLLTIFSRSDLEEWKKRIACIEKIKKVLGLIQDMYRNQLISIIRENAQSYLVQLVDDEDKERVRIEIEEVIDPHTAKKGWSVYLTSDGNRIRKPGTGQTLIKGISFIMGVFDTLTLRIPLIIDSPLVTLDDEWREHFCEALPPALMGSQTFLLVKKTEYNHNIKTILEDYIGAEYELDRKSWSLTEIKS